jgi:hypothetical protein
MNVEVVSVPLVPVITPNRAVIQYRLGDDPVLLQALNSYDPNVQRRYSEAEFQSLFEFSWQCWTLNPDSLSVHGSYMSNQDLLNYRLSRNGTFDSLFSPCILNISSSLMQIFVSSSNISSVGSTTVVILIMTEKLPFFARQSSVAAQINVIPSEAPLITIETTTVVSNVNVQNKLILVGSILSKSTCNATWSLILDNSSFQVADLTASRSFIKRINPNVPTTVTLVIKSNAFLSEVGSYTFALSCGDSSSKLMVTTNGSPTGGIFTIVPTEGQELNTLFFIDSKPLE